MPHTLSPAPRPAPIHSQPFAWLVVWFNLVTLAAAAGPLGGIAEQEIQRRAALVETAAAHLKEADELFKQGKTAEALALYESTYTGLPDVPMAKSVRDAARISYADAGTARAKELMDQGKYADATKILDTITSATVAPDHARARRLKALLANPDRYPPALTEEHIANVGEVKRLLILANSQFEIGDYDKARGTFQDVLRLDPYNSAARRGMERAEMERARYFKAARDHQRARMLTAIDEEWNEKVPLRQGMDVSNLFGAISASGAKGGRESVLAKLRGIIIPKIDFSGASINEVIEYLRVLSKDLDPGGKGVDFVVSLDEAKSSQPISLQLANVPIEDVLRYVTESVGVAYRVEDFAVRIVSHSENTSTVVSKSYRVPPDFISNAPVGDQAAPAAPADPFATTPADQAAKLSIRRMGAKEFLETRGVTFPEGTGASYNPATNTLIVRNNVGNLEIVDLLVEQAAQSSPKQVVIEVRIMEVTDNKLNELGFDWLLGGLGSEVQLGGGSAGNQQPADFVAANFPANPALGDLAPVTAGLRSSGDATINQGIDSVIFGNVAAATRRSPAAFSLAGVLTAPQFQGVVRALDQKAGVDTLASPSVVTKSGQKASIDIARELIYPTEFDPPQIPTSFGSNIVFVGTGIPPPVSLPPPIVTPTTPTAFEMRKTGVTLEVEPVISDDGRTVDLVITPQTTNFDGFVNYGTPINGLFDGVFTELTPNLIFQPIFSTRKVVTGVKIYDGATVVLGGLLSDNNVMIDDKVPLVGDIPFVGRLFQSKVAHRRTKSMLFFLTVKVIDPGGNRIHQTAATAP